MGLGLAVIVAAVVGAQGAAAPGVSTAQGAAAPAQGTPAPAGPVQGTPPLPPRPKVPGGLVAPRLAPTVIPGARPELEEEVKPAEGEATDAGVAPAAAPAPSEPEVVEPPVAPPAPVQPRPIAAVPPGAVAAPVAAPIAPAGGGGLAFNWESLALLTMLFPTGLAAGWLLQRGK